MRGLMAFYTFWFTLLRISADSCVGLLVFPLLTIAACAIYYFRILTSYVSRLSFLHTGTNLVELDSVFERSRSDTSETVRHSGNLLTFGITWVQVSWLDIIPRKTMRE